MALNNSKMNFDKVFQEHIDQVQPVEEDTSVSFTLTREEANAIHELLQSEDYYGHDAWHPVRSQLDEVVGAALAQGAKLGTTTAGKQMAANTAQAGAQAAASKTAMTAAGKGNQFKGSAVNKVGDATATAATIAPTPSEQPEEQPQKNKFVSTGSGNNSSGSSLNIQSV